MFWRIALFLLCQFAPALAVWLVYSGADRQTFALLAAVAGSYVWLALDGMRGWRLLKWLRSGDTSQIPLGSGYWGEVFDRVRKLVRSRDRVLAESDKRLQEFLAALQASPNGVVLLDRDGRIEWFNQMAAGHFGLDDRRDLLQHLGKKAQAQRRSHRRIERSDRLAADLDRADGGQTTTAPRATAAPDSSVSG